MRAALLPPWLLRPRGARRLLACFPLAVLLLSAALFLLPRLRPLRTGARSYRRSAGEVAPPMALLLLLAAWAVCFIWFNPIGWFTAAVLVVAAFLAAPRLT